MGGSIHITAEAVTVGADIESPSGSITLNAHRNDIDPVPPPLNVTVADGITLSARGVWVNELPPAPVGSGDVALVDGGKITLAADDNLALGQGSLLDVTAGGRLRADGRGRVIAGNAGEISLSGHTLSGFNENVRGFGITGGGTLTLSSNRIQIGGVPDLTADTLNLDPGFFSRTGFANIKLAGIESVTLSDNTRIRPTVVNLELLPEYRVQPSGSRVEDFSRLVTFDDLIRQPANLGLTANNPDEQGKADVLIGMGAQIEADPGAHITLSAARLIDIEGRVSAPGGSISASLQHSEEFNYNPDNGIWLGKQSGLDVSGVALTFLDTQRLTQGKVLNGGSVTLDAQFGNVITQASSTINVAGASPVRLDILNEAGGLGQWVGSDAGSLSITAREGILLDGKVVAQPGGALNRGGNLDITLGLRDVSNPQDKGFPSGDRVLSLAQTVAPQASGLTPGTPVPTELNRKAPLDATALESAGFDRLTLKGREVIRLENDLNLGVNRPLALRELVLDAPRIETAGGGVALKAEVIRLGNFDIDLQDVPNTPLSGNGTFSAEAQLLELAGNLSLGGMAQSKFSAAQEVRLSGISTSNFPRPTAMLSSAANLSFHGAVIAPATYTQFDISAPGRTVTSATTPCRLLSRYRHWAA